MNPIAIYQVYPRTFTADGTLKAAEKLLPYIKELGFDIVYLSAINKEDDSFEGMSPRQIASGFNNPKNPYRITDYFDVDEEYGTVSDLRDFIKTAHQNNLRVLIDLVYLHCGKNAVFIKEHPDFVVRDENGDIKIGDGWPFARLNFECEGLREYLISNMEFFIRDMDADGFRCDTAAHVPLDFWKESIERVKSIKPDIYMLNEGSNPESLEVFDCMYDFRFLNEVNRLFTHQNNTGKKQSLVIPASDTKEYSAKTLKEKMLEISIPTGKFLADFENHDGASDFATERLECHLGHEGADCVLAFCFTNGGIPMIYNGNELADNGPKNMFWNRFCEGVHTVRWENLLTDVGKKRLEFIKELIALRRERESLTGGNIEWLEHTNEDAVLFYKREFNGEKTVCVINTTAREQKTSIDAKINKILISQNAQIEDEITLKPYGFVIFE